MVARLREKPGGEAIPVTIGDFATTRLAREFDVVYVVFNTIMNLTTQAAQVACFRNAAAALATGGCFVVEIVDGRGEVTTFPGRYVWPSELDLMAELAGLRLRERWEGWTRAPFTSESAQHVSIWEKPAD